MRVREIKRREREGEGSESSHTHSPEGAGAEGMQAEAPASHTEARRRKAAAAAADHRVEGLRTLAAAAAVAAAVAAVAGHREEAHRTPEQGHHTPLAETAVGAVPMCQGEGGHHTRPVAGSPNWRAEVQEATSAWAAAGVARALHHPVAEGGEASAAGSHPGQRVAPQPLLQREEAHEAGALLPSAVLLRWARWAMGV